jgi:protein-disulfide isomerase
MMSILLILAALVATIFAGCGSGGSSQPSEEQQASRTAGSAEQTGDAESSGRVSEKRLGHPALGSADAPVVLTEYSDYQ